MATTQPLGGDVKDLALAEKGKRKIEWANQQMPVLQLIRKRFIKEQPLKGVRVSACLHVTSETANLAITLRCCAPRTRFRLRTRWRRAW